VDSVVAAKENAARFGYAISPNRELVALGAANVVASLTTGSGAVPVFGAITRSRWVHFSFEQARWLLNLAPAG
jgi:MFS superfamily sulfate permease-like transporter